MRKLVMVLAAVIALAACKKESKESNEPAQSAAGQGDEASADDSKPKAPHAGMGKPGGAPHAGMGKPGGDPHAGMGKPGGAAMSSPGPGPVDLGGLEVTVPKGWKPEAPKSRMRAAQYAIGPVEVAVFYFQKRGAGDVQSNFERWKKQFSKLDGEPETSEKMVGQMKVSTIDMKGTFGGGPPMRPMAKKKAPQPGTRMIGAIVESPAGPYYFKMSGPVAEVEKAADGFDDMIDSAKPSEL